MSIPAKYRGLIYGVATIALAVAFAFNLIAPEQVNGWVDAAAKAAGTVAAVLALFNLTPDEDPVDEWHE